MNLKVAFVSMLLVTCGPAHKLPAMPHQDRADYMIASGGYLRFDVRTAFKEGRVVVGMPSYLILALYGEPDLVIKCPRQNLICDEIRVYKTTATNTVGSVSIRHDTAVAVVGQVAEAQKF